MANDAQIWLKPKPSHIDENFEDFLNYLHTTIYRRDALYHESVRLLRERIAILIEDRFETPFYRQQSDVDTCMFNARLCGIWYLTVSDAQPSDVKQVLMIMINNLIQYCVLTAKSLGIQESQSSKSIEPLIRMALQLASHELPEKPVISWSDLKQPSTDIFLEKFLKNNFSGESNLRFNGFGSLTIRKSTYSIAPCGAEDLDKNVGVKKLVSNNFLPDWGIEVYCDRDSQLKAMRRGDIADIETCVDSVLEMQRKIEGDVPKRSKREYGDGDMATVEIINTGEFYVTVRSVDPGYETVIGTMRWEPKLHIYKHNYPQPMWIKALKLGSRYKARYNAYYKTFTFHQMFLDYIQLNMPIGATKEAIQYHVIKGDDYFYDFVTDEGFVLFANLNKEVAEQIGEDATLYFDIKKYGYGNYVGCVYADFSEISFDGYFVDENGMLDRPENEELFDREAACQDLVYRFIESVLVKESEVEHGVETIAPGLIKELCYALNVLQSRESVPQERYKMLSALRMLSVLAGFDTEARYTEYLSEYIKTLILFAQTDTDENKVIKDIESPEGLADDEAVGHGSDILEILKLFSAPDDEATNARLSEYIGREDDVLSHTAALVQCHNRLKGILEEKTLKGIKRQILAGLSALTVGDTTLELTNELEGLFGSEDDMKEFKESFFFAPRTAKEQRQFYTIFKCVCGMLNNRGGVLYLGVNDRGIPVGLDEDLANLARQNRVPATLDQYMIHINRLGEEWLGETVWRYVRLRPLPDYNVVAVNIEPYPYDVVSLKDGMIYLRKNNSTALVQDDSTVEDIRMRRQDARRKTDDKVIALQDAIRKERKVRLIGYHSSDGENIRSRVVEPFKIENDEYVLCYEHPQVKVFRISRIDKVAVSDDCWEHKEEHRESDIDMFNMAGVDQVNVSLQLSVGAKNALLEEYPKTKDFIRPDGAEKWRFDAKVNSLSPLMHFYLNHPDTVKILNAPGLKESVREYLRVHFGV